MNWTMKQSSDYLKDVERDRRGWVDEIFTISLCVAILENELVIYLLHKNVTKIIS